MSEYKVKSWSAFFQAIKRGDKLHDLRDKRDRNYQVGDVLVLQEYLPFEGQYTGDEVRVKITYITSNDRPCAFSSSALDRDYCILSLKLLEEPKEISNNIPNWMKKGNARLVVGNGKLVDVSNFSTNVKTELPWEQVGEYRG